MTGYICSAQFIIFCCGCLIVLDLRFIEFWGILIIILYSALISGSHVYIVTNKWIIEIQNAIFSTSHTINLNYQWGEWQTPVIFNDTFKAVY